MTYEEFKSQYPVRLNRQQEEAVRQTEGPVLLLAVPGSGKTTVLVTRLGYMLHCKGIRPEQILTVTGAEHGCAYLLHSGVRHIGD